MCGPPKQFWLIGVEGVCGVSGMPSVTVGVQTVLSEDAPRQGTESLHLQAISTATILE